MADEDEFTPTAVAESLGLDPEDDTDVEDANSDTTDEFEEGEDDADELHDEDHEDHEDEGEDHEEADEDTEKPSGGDEQEDGEQKEAVLTPEHQVGAGIQKFMADNIPPERAEEGMGYFEKSLSIVAAQMNGDYAGYWSGINPSLQQAAIDSPEAFLEQIGPMYEQAMFGIGRALTPENRRLVDNVELTEEMALKMQKQDHAIKMSQRNEKFFEGKQAQTREQHEKVAFQNNVSLAVRQTLERLESENPRSTGIREKVMDTLKDTTPSSPEQVSMMVENAFLREINAQNAKRQKHGQVNKNPVRSNRNKAARKVEDNPDIPFSREAIGKSLNI